MEKKKGKEYDDKCGELIFDGEYLNEKMNNWKYRDYIIGNHHDCCGRRHSDDWELEDEENTKNKNILKFEGEYLNGKRNWKGKEYDNNGKVIYKGEYLDGKRWNGKGKEYDNNGKLIYEGKYLNGERNCKGKEYDNNSKPIYEGEYLNWKIFENKHNKIHFHLLRVEGNLKNGFLDGIVKYYHNGNLEYEGEYLNGERNGKEKEYNVHATLCRSPNNTLLFEGEYLNHKKWNGKGKEFDRKNNLIFEGKYLNGKRWEGLIYNKEENLEYQIKNGNGKVKEIYNDFYKTIFEGEYINGEKNGKFKIFYSYNKLESEGQYINGKMHGKIIEYIGSFKGEYEYINGEKNGLCKEYSEEILIFEGYYLNGEKNGKCKVFFRSNGKLELKENI